MLYVDDNFIIGDNKIIDEAITALKQNEVKFLVDKKRAWFGQLHLIEYLKKKFGDWVKNV